MPREHGAWAMLLLPFIAAVALARSWNWSVPAALAAAIAVFAAREPLVAVFRQALVWREPRSEARAARRALVLWGIVLTAAAPLLLASVPLFPLAVFGGAGAALTTVAVWMTIANRQRAAWFQALSAAGLSSSALLAALVSTGGIPEWAWWLWAFAAFDSMAGVLVVRARIERRIATRSSARMDRHARAAVVSMLALLGAAAAAVAFGRPLLGAAAAGSSAIHYLDLRSLRDPAELRRPFTRVGLRAMIRSIAFTCLVAAALW